MAVALPLLATVASGIFSAQQAKKQEKRLDASANAPETAQAGASNSAPTIGAPAGSLDPAQTKRRKGSLLSGAGDEQVAPGAVAPATPSGPFAARKTLLGG